MKVTAGNGRAEPAIWSSACLRRGTILYILIISFAVASLDAGTAFAQGVDGTLRGVVSDVSGAVVQNAKITAQNEETRVVTPTRSSSAGSFQIPHLLPGQYTVAVSADGFSTQIRRHVRVSADQVAEVIIELGPEINSKAVEVQAGAELVQTEAAQISYAFDSNAILEIPTMFPANGQGSALNLSVFLPDTTSQLGGTSGSGGSIGGLRSRQNYFSVDGINNTDPQSSTPMVGVIQDAVAEFAIATNHFSAENGAASGGQFNLLTRTGGEKLKGSAWLYGSNRHFNSLDSHEKELISSGAQSEKSRFDYIRTGLSVGGPILRDRLFFFGAYEFQNTGLQGDAPSILAPTTEGLSTLERVAADPAVRSLLRQFPTAPTSQTFIPITIETQSIPIPVGRAITKAPSYRKENSFIGNVDLYEGSHQFHFRGLQGFLNLPNHGFFPQANFDSTASTRNQTGSLNYSWSASPRSVNNFRASAGRMVLDFPLKDVAAKFPTIIIGNLGAVIGPSGNLPQGRTSNTYQLSENIASIWGRHIWQMGAEYRWTTSSSAFLPNSRGQYAYQTLSRFVNDRIPDLPGASFQGIGDGGFSGNAKNLAWYVQDNIQLSPRMTLNLGLRYDFFGSPKGARDNALNAVADCPTCITPFGPPLVFREPKDDKNNFAPSVGFGWDPTGAGRWSIRAGAGMAYDQVPYSFFSTSAPPQKRAILNLSSACAGTFGVPPGWCPAFTAGQPGADFIGSGAMNIDFVPPTVQAAARALTSSDMPDNISPQVFNWFLDLQHALMKDTTVDLRYLGTRALRLPLQTQLNAESIYERGFPGLPTYLTTADIPAVAPLDAPTVAAAKALIKPRFADQGFLNVVTAYPAVGSSRYHAGSIDVNHRMSRGLFLRFNYTLSRAQDNSTNDSFTSVVNPRRAEDAFDLAREWSRSAMDIHQKFALMWIYDVPNLTVGPGIVQKLLGSWRWSGSYLWQGGQPITVQSGFDSNGNGDSAGDRAIVNPSGKPETGSAAKRVCRNPETGSTNVDFGCPDNQTIGYVAANPNAKYIQAQLGSFTDVGRNTENSKPQNVWNMALLRTIKPSERTAIQLQISAYNVFNHHTFSLAGPSVFQMSDNAQSFSYTNVASSGFLNAKQFPSSARMVQAGLRIIF